MIIIITGSSAGIGFAMAEYLAAKGHTVYGFSRKIPSTTNFTTIPTDVTDEAQVQEAVLKVLSKENRIDVLINNAGMGMVGAVEDSKKADILRLFNLNLVGAAQMMSAVLPAMRKQAFGRIINISSIGSEMGLPFRGFYSASKAALDKVTEAVRYEVAPWSIQVCSVHLGDIKTNIAENRVLAEVSEPYARTFEKTHTLMNAHVTEGTPPEGVAEYIDGLLKLKKWKAHYYFGKFGQKIGVPLKWILPQNIFEQLMKKYNKL